MTSTQDHAAPTYDEMIAHIARCHDYREFDVNTDDVQTMLEDNKYLAGQANVLRKFFPDTDTGVCPPHLDRVYHDVADKLAEITGKDRDTIFEVIILD